MSKRTVIYLSTVIIVLAIFGITFFLVDFNLVVRNQEPKLCINTKVDNDGNTKEYFGLFYKIIRYNIGSENLVNKFGTWLLTYDNDLNKKEKEKIKENINTKYDIIGEITFYDKDELEIEVKSNSDKSKYDSAIIRLSSDTVISKSSQNLYKKDLAARSKS